MTQHLHVELVHAIPRGDAKVNEFLTGSWLKSIHGKASEVTFLIKAATRDQVNSQLWRAEHKYRFTASNFHLISYRQRNNETFAKTLIIQNPLHQDIQWWMSIRWTSMPHKPRRNCTLN